MLRGAIAGENSFTMSLKAGEWAAWVQAIGSIAAIGAGFGYAYLQARWQDQRRERDRDDRAQVVAFRLNGCLDEVGRRIKDKTETYGRLAWDGKLPQPHQIVRQWNLDLQIGIDDVMPDLHYLRAGSGAVAQLDYQISYFDAFLQQWYDKSLFKATTASALNQQEMETIYKTVEHQLSLIRQLHADAKRHLDPILQAALAKSR
jgi:hypothetical protein